MGGDLRKQIRELGWEETRKSCVIERVIRVGNPRRIHFRIVRTHFRIVARGTMTLRSFLPLLFLAEGRSQGSELPTLAACAVHWAGDTGAWCVRDF